MLMLTAVPGALLRRTGIVVGHHTVSPTKEGWAGENVGRNE